MCVYSFGYAQLLTDKDTLYIIDDSFDEEVFYDALDSTNVDLRNNRVTLVKEAIVRYGDITMTADYIIIDLDKNEVTATYLSDSLGNITGRPAFDDGIEKMTASTIRYNFNTEKGYIEDVMTKQDENFLYMGVAKRHPNEEVHFKEGKFTTCDLEEPHFHFQLSKAILIPEKRIVSGPMNLWVKGIPTPLGLPFAIIPQSKDQDRISGFIFPQIIPASQYGFGFEKLGYYIPINDNLQTTVYGTIYSRGTFGLGAVTDYSVKYKYSGAVDLGYDLFRNGFPSNDSRKNFRVNWQHNQDKKGNPNWYFRSNVNFTSINDPQTNVDPTNGQYLNNAFLSDISLDRSFGNLPIRAGIKLSARQSSSNKTTDLTSPVVNFNMTQIFPLQKLVASSRGWRQAISRFGVTYDMEGKNQSNFADSLMQQGDFQAIQDKFKNGIFQKATAKTTIGLFKNALKINPSFIYSNSYNFQTSERFDDSLKNETTGLYDNFFVNSRVLNVSDMAQTMDFTANATTVFYSYYKTLGKNKPIIRHVFTPTIGYTYRPNMNKNSTFISGYSGDTIAYSRFENSIYSASSTRDQSLLTFNMNNTLELKRKSAKDTITGFQKIKLIDNFSVSGNYDFEKDSMKLSNFSTNLRISPLKALSLQVNGTFSPYDWNDSTGTSFDSYALKSRGNLGRFTNLSFATSYTLTSRKSLKKLDEVRSKMEENWTADYQYFIEHPEQIISFEIPWKVTMSYNSSWTANQFLTAANSERSAVVQTIQMDGDASFTKRWKITGNANFDLETSKITYSQFSVVRDLHCWQLSFQWTPIAQVKYFSFQMNAKSSLFQDAKLRFNKPPFFL